MVYYLYSFARAGHHAVMNWICEQSRPSVYFDNSTILKGENLSIKSNTHTMFPDNSDEIAEVRLRGVNRKGKNIVPILPKVSECKLVVIGFIYANIVKRSNLYLKNKNVIIVLRDPYNWVASRVKHGGGVLLKTKGLLPLWKDYAKICLGDIKLHLDNLNLIDINYNAWFSSEEYRKNLANRLGIQFTDKGLGYLKHMGISKFQSEETNGRKLNVLERYNEIDVNSYIDDEMKELSKRYFGEL